MKVSFHNQRATPTTKHNDRSMYRQETMREKGYSTIKNRHFDCFDCGSSDEAEKRFYEMVFQGQLDEQNANAVKQRKRDKVMTMNQWREKHPPQECVVQLGDAADAQDKDVRASQYAFVVAAVNMLAEKFKEMEGVQVLSVDIHGDEATPHAHIRYVMLDEDKRLNIKGCLARNGIEPPNANKPEGRNNTRQMAFTRSLRDDLEKLGAKYSPDGIDRSRGLRKRHMSVDEFKEYSQRIEALEEGEKAMEAKKKTLQKRENEVHEAASRVAEKEKVVDAAISDATEAKKRFDEAFEMISSFFEFFNENHLKNDEFKKNVHKYIKVFMLGKKNDGAAYYKSRTAEQLLEACIKFKKWLDLQMGIGDDERSEADVADVEFTLQMQRARQYEKNYPSM